MKIWFQNRRSKMKKMMKQRPNGSLEDGEAFDETRASSAQPSQLPIGSCFPAGAQSFFRSNSQPAFNYPREHSQDFGSITFNDKQRFH